MTNPNAKGPFWLDRARKHIGEREIKGPRHNPKIIQWWIDIGASWFNDDETPWCGAFVGGVLAKCGFKVSWQSARALWWKDYGKKIDRPAVGCLMVMDRSGGGHVCFCVGQDQHGNLMGLGGNQGDMVNIRPFARSRVKYFRWPSIAPHSYRYDLPVIDSNGKISTNEA